MYKELDWKRHWLFELSLGGQAAVQGCYTRGPKEILPWCYSMTT